MKATIEVNQTADEIHTVAKQLGGQTVTLTDVSTAEVETLLRKAGSKIANVRFTKRSNNGLRRMCYRLGVTNPQTASKPKGKTNRKDINKKNTQMTVYDTNKVVRDVRGAIKYDENGKQLRGAWRTVPLENVTRIAVDGVIYEIVS
jgi:hypothetical protein